MYSDEVKEKIVDRILVTGLDKKINFPEFFKYLKLGKFNSPDMSYVFNNSFNFEVYLESSLSQYFFYFLDSYEIYLEKPVDVVFDSSLLNIKDLNSIERLSSFISNLNLLCNYCDEIHLHIKFIDLLYGLKNKEKSFLKYFFNNLNACRKRIKFVCKDLHKLDLDIDTWLNLDSCPFIDDKSAFEKNKDIVRLYLYHYLK